MTKISLLRILTVFVLPFVVEKSAFAASDRVNLSCAKEHDGKFWCFKGLVTKGEYSSSIKVSISPKQKGNIDFISIDASASYNRLAVKCTRDLDTGTLKEVSQEVSETGVGVVDTYFRNNFFTTKKENFKPLLKIFEKHGVICKTLHESIINIIDEKAQTDEGKNTFVINGVTWKTEYSETFVDCGQGVGSYRNAWKCSTQSSNKITLELTKSPRYLPYEDMFLHSYSVIFSKNNEQQVEHFRSTNELKKYFSSLVETGQLEKEVYEMFYNHSPISF